MQKIQEHEISYSYDTRGYMMYYREKPIGGAGLAKRVAGCRANLKLFKEQADLEKRRILAGMIDSYKRDVIEKIQQEAKDETLKEAN